MSVVEADYIVNKTGGLIDVSQINVSMNVYTTFTGPYTATMSLQFSAVGGIVTMVIPEALQAATATNAAFFSSTSSVVPIQYRCISDVYIPIVVQVTAGPDLYVIGSVTVLSSGFISIHNCLSTDPTTGTFSAAPQVCGWSRQTVSWSIS